jgi:AcrR family transcriptional regulator
VEQFRNFPITRDFAKSPGDVDTAPPEGFLYQCGYLTLRPGTTNDLALDYPNTEVLNSMSQLFSQNIVTEAVYNHFQNRLLAALMDKDADRLVDVLNRLLASIPYDDYTQAEHQDFQIDGVRFPAQEWLYRSTILAFLRGCGVMVIPEAHTNLGRSDLVVAHRGVTWVIEIKVAYAGDDPAKKAEEAFRQIENKNYAKLFPEAVCIGLAIDDAVRQITDRELRVES